MEPATITINVHGTNPGDETIQAFTRTVDSQTDFFALDGKDGNDTVVFNSVTLTSGTGLEISLGKSIVWTEYAGKALVNIENITIKDTDGNLLRTMTVGGDDKANVITIENTDHKLTILSRGGDDTVNFKGTGNGLTSTINGGAGNDTVNAYSDVVVNVAEGNDTVNVLNGSNVTVESFTAGDKIVFGAGVQASNVSSAVVGGNTVLTINQDGVTSTVTMKGATNLVAGTDWTAGSVVEPPPPAAEPGLVIRQTGGSTQITEGGTTDTFTIALATAPTAPVTVVVAGDYFQVASNPDDPYGELHLTFTPENWNVPQTVTAIALDDMDPEDATTGGLYISTLESADPAYNSIYPDNGYVAVSVTDNDNGDTAPPAELPEINAVSASGEVTEGSVATFTFTRTGDLSQALTVAVDTSIGSAKPDTDFTAPSTITFEAGSDTATLEVQTLTDVVVEDPTTIEVRIVPDAGYTIGLSDGNVADLVDSQGTDPVDPEPVRPSLSINDVTVDENAGTATFTVTLSAATTSAVSVAYALSGPAALVSAASGTLIFAPGETSKTVAVPVADNTTVATGAQQFVVNLSNVSANATLADLVGQGTITDDDLPIEMPALTIATTAGLTENSTISWNAIPGAASYVFIGTEPDDPTAPPHTLGFAVAPSTSYAINGNDEFTGMVITVEARDANGGLIARSENQTDLIANINDAPTGRPVISDNTPEVGQLLTISIGDLEDGDGMRTDRPDEFGYIWERSTGDGTWSLVSTTDSYQVTEADAGFLIRGAAQYADRGDTLETVYALTTAKVNDPNPDTPPVAFDDVATTKVGEAVTIDVLANDFDFEADAITVTSYGQGLHGTVAQTNGTLVYTPNAGFVGTDTFTYTLNGGDTGKVSVTVEQPDAGPLTLLTVDGLDENSTLEWTAVPGAVSYVLIGTEPDDPTAPPHELDFALAPATTYNIAGNDEFAGMAIHVEARGANGVVLTRSVNETTAIENINDVPTGNLSVDDMTPEVGQVLTLGYGTFEDGDGYRDRGRPEEFEWAFERSLDGVTWTTIVTGASAGEDGPFGFSYTVTQADNGYFLRGRAIYEDRAGDTIETVYSLSTSKVGATLPGGGTGTGGDGTGGNGSGGDGTGGTGGTGGDETGTGSLTITMDGNAVTATELGTNGTFAIALAEAPTANVTVTIMGDNQVSGQAADGSAQMIFTTENWNVAQTVTVMAIEDGVDEGPHTGEVWLDMFSDDPRYAGAMQTQSVNVTDSAPEVLPPYVSVAYRGGDVTEGEAITFDFMRREGVNTHELAIDLAMEGLDPSDIETILWNGSETGVKGFRAGAATATMTVVLADDAVVEGPESLNVTVLFTEAHIDDVDGFASATVLDNDVAAVEPANQAPTAGAVILPDVGEDDTAYEVDVFGEDTDGNPLTYRVVTEPAKGTVTWNEAGQRFLFNANGEFEYLNDGDTETVTFTYVANDGQEDSNVATVSITVNGTTDVVALVNQAPTAAGVVLPNVGEDETAYEVDVFGEDADGDPLTYRLVTGPEKGTVTWDEAGQRFLFNANGEFEHLNNGQTEEVTFTYVANDGIVDSAPATVTITIVGITDQRLPDPEPAQFADAYNYDLGNGGPAGQRTVGDNIINDGVGLASTIQGLGGNDTIYGKDNNDNLIGGNGSDTIYGGTGNDQITGDGGPDPLTNANNAGEPGPDLLYGGDGNDTISGLEGNDTITGGHGADTLTGGFGDDTFVFNDIFDRGDTIAMQGQLVANDVFDFRNFDFDPNTVGAQDAVNGLQIVNAAPTAGSMAEDTFYYDASTGRLSLNTGTDGLEDFYVTLLLGNVATGAPLPRLNADDILV